MTRSEVEGDSIGAEIAADAEPSMVVTIKSDQIHGPRHSAVKCGCDSDANRTRTTIPIGGNSDVIPVRTGDDGVGPNKRLAKGSRRGEGEAQKASEFEECEFGFHKVQGFDFITAPDGRTRIRLSYSVCSYNRWQRLSPVW